MEFLIVTTLCISLSILLTPCASQQMQVQSSHEQAHEVQLPLPTQLPRKLRFTEEVTVKGHGVQDTVTYNKQKEDSSAGKPYQKEQSVIHGSKGTWNEWMEGTETSQFFTMDYSHVRRRRPIHNKAVPVGP